MRVFPRYRYPDVALNLYGSAACVLRLVLTVAYSFKPSCLDWSARPFKDPPSMKTLAPLRIGTWLGVGALLDWLELALLDWLELALLD